MNVPNEDAKPVEAEATTKEQNKTVQATETAEGSDKPAEVGAENTQTDEKKEKKVPKWLQERVNQATLEKHAETRKRLMAEDQVRALTEELAKRPKAEKNEDVAQPVKAGYSEDEVDRRATEKAKEIANTNAFTVKCNAIFDKGVEDYSDFKEVLGNFNMLGGMNKDFLETVTELDDAPAIIHALGSDPEEASRIMALKPSKMAIELSRMERDLASGKQKPVSKAPAPIRPVDARGAAAEKGLEDPKLSTKAWIAERNKQLQAKKANGR